MHSDKGSEFTSENFQSIKDIHIFYGCPWNNCVIEKLHSPFPKSSPTAGNTITKKTSKSAHRRTTVAAARTAALVS